MVNTSVRKPCDEHPTSNTQRRTSQEKRHRSSFDVGCSRELKLGIVLPVPAIAGFPSVPECRISTGQPSRDLWASTGRSRHLRFGSGPTTCPGAGGKGKPAGRFPDQRTPDSSLCGDCSGSRRRRGFPPRSGPRVVRQRCDRVRAERPRRLDGRGSIHSGHRRAAGPRFGARPESTACSCGPQVQPCLGLDLGDHMVQFADIVHFGFFLGSEMALLVAPKEFAGALDGGL